MSSETVIAEQHMDITESDAFLYIPIVQVPGSGFTLGFISYLHLNVTM